MKIFKSLWFYVVLIHVILIGAWFTLIKISKAHTPKPIEATK